MNDIFSQEVQSRVRQLELAEQQAKEEIAKKNYNFIQIQKKALKLLRDLIDKNATAARIITLMAEKMNKQNALVCSYDTLMKITGMSRSTLVRSIKYLKDHKWIDVVKVGSANAYIINSNIFWQDEGDKRFAVFNAVVIASSDEQDESVEEWDNVKLKHYPFLSHDDDSMPTI
jgi:hypothetical protein